MKTNSKQKIFRNNQKEEISLEDLANDLIKSHLRLNLYFLNKLLKNASHSEKPHYAKNFLNLIECTINKIKQRSGTVYEWLKGYRTVPMSKLIKIIELSDYSWKDIEDNLLSIKAGINHGEINPKFPIKINDEIGRIIGHILGDGSIEKANHRIFFSNSNIELLEEFMNIMKKIFGIEPHIWVQEKRKFEEKSKWLKRVYNLNDIPIGHNAALFYPKICSDILYSIFGKFAEGKNKIITNQIKNSNLDLKKGLIRSFFDSDGGINYDNRGIRFFQDDLEILKQLKLIIEEFNIDTCKIRGYIKKDKLRHYFGIYGFKNYYRFYEIIGCTSSNKVKKFELLINKVKK